METKVYVATLTTPITTSVIGLYEDIEDAMSGAENDYKDKYSTAKSIPLYFRFNDENNDDKMWAVVPFKDNGHTYFIEGI